VTVRAGLFNGFGDADLFSGVWIWFSCACRLAFYAIYLFLSCLYKDVFGFVCGLVCFFLVSRVFISELKTL